jgi:hypothetical protein
VQTNRKPQVACPDEGQAIDHAAQGVAQDGHGRRARITQVDQAECACRRLRACQIT